MPCKAAKRDITKFMKLKHFLLATSVATLALSASAANPNATVDQVRIYINPGHGTYTSEDRPMATIKHGAAMADTAGFYESNTNMQKAYGLLDKLREYGVPFDPSKSVTYYYDSNGNKKWYQNNIRMSHATTGISPGLSTVAEEAQTMNADVFISIHSNANQGDGDNPSGHTNFNQCLFLHRGWDGDPYVAGSDKIARACWNHAIKNKHMHYNWLTDPTLPYDVGDSNWGNASSFPGRKYYPSGKDADGNPYWIKGDVTFQYNTDRNNSSYTRYYGVLNHNIPGFLVEGYDHTYRPAMHRAMNDDVCRHEGEMYARGLNDYFGWGIKDSYGKIYGIVRDQSVTMNHTYWSVIQNPTRDANKYIDPIDNKKPLNNVTVTLYNSNGVAVDTYTTDDEWNGAYFFKKVAPGNYTIKHFLSGYKEVTQTVTVTANETNYLNIDMREAGAGEPVQGHFAYGLNLTKNNEQTYTATFSSTGAMSNGKIILTNSSTSEQTVIETGAVEKGTNTITIDATKLAVADYTWKVALDNPASTAYSLIHSDNSVVTSGAALGLAIDNDETSANFGNIYTNTGLGQGIQRFNPDLSKNGGKVLSGYFGTGGYANRLTVNSGKVYVANYSTTNPGVWVYNPSATTASTTNIWATRANGVAFYGEGANRKMYTVNGSSRLAYGHNIGASDTKQSTASTTFSNINAILHNDGDVLATNKGLFISQRRYRVGNNSTAPAFMLASYSDVLNYTSEGLSGTLPGTERGGMALSKDQKTFAIVDGWEQTSSYVGIEGDIELEIYSVSWSGNTPSFTHQYTIPLSGTHRVDQMAFDHADNLYVASREQGLLVYAIKNPSRQTVTNGAGTITGAEPEIPSAVDPEDAPNPDAEPGETDEAEDPQTEGYFAYGLSLTKSGNEYTFSFKSTGARKNGRIVLTNKSTGVKTEIKTPIVKGQNTVKVNAYDIVKGDYTWAVKMTNNANSTIAQVGSDNSIIYNNGSANARIGVAIDRDETSANFGTIYTMTAMGQGLQKYNADMTKNGSKILTGMFGQDEDATSANRFRRTTRLEVNGGKVYIANYASKNSGVWMYDPSGSATATSVESSPKYERAVAFHGTGSNRKAFVYHEKNLRRYDIGTTSSWAQAGYAKAYTGLMSNGDGDVIVTDNGVIASQHRFNGNNVASEPVFAVYDHNLNLVTTSASLSGTLRGTQIGGMALSPDNKTFVIVDGWAQTNTGQGIEGDIEIDVYNITWSGSTPSFSYQYSIPLSGTKQVDQMEFDHAGNLYIASQQKGLLKYAVKTSARETVTSSTATVTGLGNAVPTNVVATRQCYGEGNNTTAGSVDAKVTWTGDAGQYKVYYSTMRRDESGNRVNDTNGAWVEAGTATIASGSTSGSFTHQGLAHGGDYDRIYNYKVANYYATPDYVGTSKSISGKGRTVTSFAPRVPVSAVFSQPTVEVNGVSQYTLDLKLDLSLNSNVFSASLLDDNDALPKASRYVIVVDEATAAVLNNASNANEVGEFVEGPIILSTNNCNHYEVNGWYMIVDFDDVNPSGDLSKATKSFTWEDVDLSMTYQPQVYTISTRAFNFTANTPESVAYNIKFPTPQWSAINTVEGDNGEVSNIAEVIPVTGNQISLVAGSEDMPIGAFRKVGDTENATNPVSITQANVIGATGVIQPLPAIDEIMNEWDITYTFMLKDSEGNVLSTLPQESKNSGNSGNLYSNTEQRQVDVLGLQVGCDATTAPDGRMRYVYNAAKNKEYKLVVLTTYSRVINGETVEYSNESEADIEVAPSFPSPEIDLYNSPGYLFLETSTHWDENCKDDQGNYINSGYYNYYYDAAMDIAWNDFEDNLVRYMGYYAKPSTECVGHPDANTSEWVPYLAASIMTNGQVEAYNDRISRTEIDNTLLSGIGYTGSEDWSTLAAGACHIPVKVHYVWAGNEKLPDGSTGDAKFNWELSANYPVIVYDAPLLKVNSGYSGDGSYDISAPLTRSVAGYDMQMITTINQGVQTLIMDGFVELPTTGVENVGYGSGALRLFPNPANSIVTLQAPVTITDVRIFTVDGQLVKEFEANDTKVRLNVSDLPSGVYIVNAGNSTTRLIKK